MKINIKIITYALLLICNAYVKSVKVTIECDGKVPTEFDLKLVGDIISEFVDVIGRNASLNWMVHYLFEPGVYYQPVISRDGLCISFIRKIDANFDKTRGVNTFRTFMLRNKEIFSRFYRPVQLVTYEIFSKIDLSKGFNGVYFERELARLLNSENTHAIANGRLYTNMVPNTESCLYVPQSLSSDISFHLLKSKTNHLDIPGQVMYYHVPLQIVNEKNGLIFEVPGFVIRTEFQDSFSTLNQILENLPNDEELNKFFHDSEGNLCLPYQFGPMAYYPGKSYPHTVFTNMSSWESGLTVFKIGSYDYEKEIGSDPIIRCIDERIAMAR